MPGPVSAVYVGQMIALYIRDLVPIPIHLYRRIEKGCINSRNPAIYTSNYLYLISGCIYFIIHYRISFTSYKCLGSEVLAEDRYLHF